MKLYTKFKKEKYLNWSACNVILPMRQQVIQEHRREQIQAYNQTLAANSSKLTAVGDKQDASVCEKVAASDSTNVNVNVNVNAHVNADTGADAGGGKGKGGGAPSIGQGIEKNTGKLLLLAEMMISRSVKTKEASTITPEQVNHYPPVTITAHNIQDIEHNHTTHNTHTHNTHKTLTAHRQACAHMYMYTYINIYMIHMNKNVHVV